MLETFCPTVNAAQDSSQQDVYYVGCSACRVISKDAWASTQWSKR